MRRPALAATVRSRGARRGRRPAPRVCDRVAPVVVAAAAAPSGRVAVRSVDSARRPAHRWHQPTAAAPAYFAYDFPAIRDNRLDVPVGGVRWAAPAWPLRHTPVVFVHGNQADAQNWLAVMLQFQNLAGYSMQEMYAISYNGLGNAYAGMPTSAPTAPDQDYFGQNPEAFANGGHGAADDDEVPDLCRFVEAVQAYTGSRKVDIVAHSLGVTIVRKLMADYPPLPGTSWPSSGSPVPTTARRSAAGSRPPTTAATRSRPAPSGSPGSTAATSRPARPAG